VERVLDGVQCVMLHGAQGDSNHICVDLSNPVSRRLPTDIYIHMGRAIGGVAVGLWDICVPLESGKVGYGITEVKVKTNRGRPEQVPEARRIMNLSRTGKRDQIPGEGMQRVTIEAQARRIEYLANGPDYFDFPLSAVTVGGALAFVGFPGEPFTGYGVSIKAKSPFAVTMPACVANGSFGYLPVDAAFKEAGYETQGSLFVEGLEKTIIDGHMKQLNSLVTR
jgi:hypothetical protein